MVKANNYFLGQKFRDITKTAGVDTPVQEYAVPTIVINPTDAGVEVQPSFPKPNVKQTLKVHAFMKSGAADVQIATPDATKNFYVVGWIGINSVGVNTSVYDAISGSSSAPSDASTNCILYATGSETAKVCFLPLPVKVNQGIRVSCSGSGPNLIIYYIEESLLI